MKIGERVGLARHFVVVCALAALALGGMWGCWTSVRPLTAQPKKVEIVQDQTNPPHYKFKVPSTKTLHLKKVDVEIAVWSLTTTSAVDSASVIFGESPFASPYFEFSSYEASSGVIKVGADPNKTYTYVVRVYLQGNPMPLLVDPGIIIE